MLDTIGIALWYGMFVTPLITVPLMWRIKDVHWLMRIITGLFLAFMLSVIMFYTSLAIIFRDGMGPG